MREQERKYNSKESPYLRSETPSFLVRLLGESAKDYEQSNRDTLNSERRKVENVLGLLDGVEAEINLRLGHAIGITRKIVFAPSE